MRVETRSRSGESGRTGKKCTQGPLEIGEGLTWQGEVQLAQDRDIGQKCTDEASGVALGVRRVEGKWG